MKTLIARITALMEAGAVPRLHPNGFYTLDLSPVEKLHVWPDRKVRRRTDEGFIHDHTFAFRSLVLVGALTDTRFHLVPDKDGDRLYRLPSHLGRSPETKVHPVEELRKYRPTPTERHRIEAGSAYEVPASVFHRTDPEGFTATWLMITDIGTTTEACVLVPRSKRFQMFDRTLNGTEEAAAGFAIGRVVHLLEQRQA